MQRTPPNGSGNDPRRAPFCACSSKAQRVRRAPPTELGTGSRRAPFCACSSEAGRPRGGIKRKRNALLPCGAVPAKARLTVVRKPVKVLGEQACSSKDWHLIEAARGMNKHEGNDTHHAAEDAARCILSMKPVDDGGRVLDRTNDGIGRTMGSAEPGRRTVRCVVVRIARARNCSPPNKKGPDLSGPFA